MKRTRKSKPEPGLPPLKPGYRHAIDWATHTVRQEKIPEFETERSPRPAAPDAEADDAPDDTCDPPPPPFDPHGFDPADFEWRPVPRRPRADGWTPEVQRHFIETLADTGMVSAAARAVDMTVQSAYRLRRSPGSESFARAWAVVLDAASDSLADIAFSRAIEGVEEPVFDRDGCRIGARTRYNDRLVMFLLRAYRPDQFRHAHEAVRRPGEAPQTAPVPLAEAAAALAPVTPPDPHRLATPERLEQMVDVAQALADLEERHPRPCEGYRQPPAEDAHPAAVQRRVDRIERAASKARRAADRASRDMISGIARFLD